MKYWFKILCNKSIEYLHIIVKYQEFRLYTNIGKMF